MRKLSSQGCISGVGQRSPMERKIIPSEILQEQEEGVITASQQTNQKCGWWCITSNSLSGQTTNMKNYRSLRGALAYCDSGVQKAEVRERTNPHSLLVSGLGDSVTGSVTMTASLLPPGKGKLHPTPWLYVFISPKSKHNALLTWGWKEKAIHSIILAWKVPWAEEPRGLQPMESQRVRYNLMTNQQAGTAQIRGPHHFIATYTLYWDRSHTEACFCVGLISTCLVKRLLLQKICGV